MAAHCQPTPSDRDAGADAGADAGTDAGDDLRAQCQAACDRFDALDCEQAQPTPEGVSCVDVCLNVEREGILSIDPVCIAEVSVEGSAGAANQCFAIEEACAE